MRNPFNLNQVDLNLLKIFDLLMQERSVTRAAEKAGRTQSAISHALNRLREIFGDELFVKQGGAMNPTYQARELASVVSQALSDIQSAVDRHIRFVPQESERQFRVGFTDYTGALYLPALIEMFNKSAPYARLKIVPVYIYDAAELLSSLDLDCVLIGNPVINDRQIVETVLAKHQMLCAAWKENPAIDNLTLDKYLKTPHLQISPDGNETGVSDKALAALGLKRQVAATIPYYMIAPRVLIGTNMIAAFADGMISLLGNTKEIAVSPPPFQMPEVTISLMYMRTKQADAGHIWLRSCIRSVVGLCEEEKEKVVSELYKPD